MKTPIKALVFALVVVFMTVASIISASAATVPAKNVKSINHKHNSQNVKIEVKKKIDVATVIVPWSNPNPTGWTNPNARKNSIC